MNYAIGCIAMAKISNWKIFLLQAHQPHTISCEHSMRHNYMQVSCLDDKRQLLDMTKFGYSDDDDCFVPTRLLVMYPDEDELVPSCTCGKVCEEDMRVYCGRHTMLHLLQMSKCCQHRLPQPTLMQC